MKGRGKSAGDYGETGDCRPWWRVDAGVRTPPLVRSGLRHPCPFPTGAETGEPGGKVG